jgi:elongation factor G
MKRQQERPLFPLITCVVEPQIQADGEKLNLALIALCKLDPSFFYISDETTNATRIGGMSETHLDNMVTQLSRENVMVNLKFPEIVYRGTVTTSVSADFTHKKLFGGEGQFARVILKIEPKDVGAGYEFQIESLDANFPERFIVGIEKGLASVLNAGPFVRTPNFDVKVSLMDGVYHESDSSVLTFEIAARAALRDALESAGKLVLEPVMRVEVTTTENFIEVIIGDLNTRRGTIVDTTEEDGIATLTAIVPLSEIFGYDVKLRALSEGHAHFDMRYSHYQALPGIDPTDPGNFPPAMAMRA